MCKIPYFQFYAENYLAYSRALTAEQIKDLMDYMSDICLFGKSNVKLTNDAQIELVKAFSKGFTQYKSSVENGKKGGAPKGNFNAKKQPKNNPEDNPENNLNYNPENNLNYNPENNLEYNLEYNPEHNPERKEKEKAPQTPKEKNKIKIYTPSDTGVSVSPKGDASQETEPKEKTKRACRFEKSEFYSVRLPEAFAQEAEKLCVPPDMAQREYDKFGDYWVAKSGQSATKLDWLATWRNWLRSAGNSGGGGRQKAAIETQSWQDFIGLTAEERAEYEKSAVYYCI